MTEQEFQCAGCSASGDTSQITTPRSRRVSSMRPADRGLVPNACLSATRSVSPLMQVNRIGQRLEARTIANLAAWDVDKDVFSTAID